MACTSCPCMILTDILLILRVKTWISTLFLKDVGAEKLSDGSLTSSVQLNQYESARQSKNTPAVKSPCFGYSIVALSAAAEWLLSGWSWQNIVCLYMKIWTIKKVYQERLMNADSHTSGNKSLVPVLSLSLSLFCSEHDVRCRLRFGCPGDRLSSADSADRSSETLHQTPEEREQQTEGTSHL